MRLLDGITDLIDMDLFGLQQLLMNWEAWHAVVHGIAKSRTWLRDWTELNWRNAEDKKKKMSFAPPWEFQTPNLHFESPRPLSGEGNGTPLQCSCSPWGRWGLDTTEQLHFHFSLSCIGEGNGNPLQCSCLENPRDGGAWWAAVFGVPQSWTRLKWLSSSSSSRPLFLLWHPELLISLLRNWLSQLLLLKLNP